jgi:hypothetical protein
LAGSTLVVGGLEKLGCLTLAGILPPQATWAGAVGAPALASLNWEAGVVVAAPAAVVAAAAAGGHWSSHVSHSL